MSERQPEEELHPEPDTATEAWQRDYADVYGIQVADEHGVQEWSERDGIYRSIRGEAGIQKYNPDTGGWEKQ